MGRPKGSKNKTTTAKPKSTAAKKSTAPAKTQTRKQTAAQSGARTQAGARPNAKTQRARQTRPQTAAKGKAGGAGNTAARKPAAARPQSKASGKQSSSGLMMEDEFAIIAAFGCAVLLFLSNLGFCGPLGAVLRNVQLGLFGSIGYLFPIILVAAVAFFVLRWDDTRALLKLAASLGMLICVSALIQLTAGGGASLGDMPSYFQQAADTGVGGGVLGGMLAQLLYSLIGWFGAFLILFAAVFAGLVFVTEKPLAHMLATGSIAAAGRAREDFTSFAEETRVRAEERRQLRQERASGVDFQATDLSLQFRKQLGMPKNPDGTLAYKSISDLNDGQVHLWNRALSEKEEPEEGWLDEDYADDADEALNEDFYKDGDAADYDDADGDGAMMDAADAASYDAAAADDARAQGEEDDPYSRFTGRIFQSGGAQEQPSPEKPLGGAFGAEVVSDASLRTGAGFAAQMVSSAFLERIPTRTALREEAGGLSGAKDINDPAQSGKGGQRLPASVTNAASGAAAATEAAEDASLQHFSSADDEPSVEAAPNPYDAVPSEERIRALHAQDKDMFGQAAGTRRITTASGRVIESDMDDLHKRVERRREEAAQEQVLVQPEAEAKEKEAPKKPYVFPDIALLKRGVKQQSQSTEEIRETAIKLQQTLKSFGVGVTVTDVSVGPAVTRYELHPEQGVKVSRIVALTDDIKLSLAASDIRIEAPIPGKSAVGIEVPNKENVMVYLGDVIGSETFIQAGSKLSFAVGKDIGGQTVVTDLAKMPHLLIAGATGSGKSVCINTIIMSLIYKASPEEVRLIMIDPKVVELQVYNGIPHLLIPVVTDPKKASAALNWGVAEMTDRYKKFAELGVRDLKGYNARVEAVQKDESVPEDQKPKKLPQIVIIVDELADLMMVAPGEVEDAICRLAQLARAAGIHLVIATQRPSVNVITGLIKANVPSRIAFAVSSGVDSRTIIDMNGAEKLLGKGDMLFYPSGIPKPVRVQGAFVSDAEVQAVVDFLTADGAAEYSSELALHMEQGGAQESAQSGAQDERDALFYEAGMLIIEADKASIGMLQRKFRIGFNRAARIMDQLAEAQVVGPDEGTKPRKILMSMEEFNEI